MSFLFINKTLQLDNLKTRTVMNAKISVFVICVESIIYLLSYNLHDCTFKRKWQKQPPEVFYKKAVLKNFAIFTGKQLRWSFYLIKVGGTVVFLWILQNFKNTIRFFSFLQQNRIYMIRIKTQKVLYGWGEVF